jgi:hypothetical protein
MTREEFRTIKPGDVVDVLDVRFERSWIPQKVVSTSPCGIYVRASNAKGRRLVSNERRVEFWMAKPIDSEQQHETADDYIRRIAEHILRRTA